ncbi:hypothetical protein AAFP35_24275 [Gordonia sp. CPCC 206044]|uniref:hypothetical protein n=1 Tax=Gordonia sp. CPCC 206044 TaxID=3140793 RepID=UPI003AF3A963
MTQINGADPYVDVPDEPPDEQLVEQSTWHPLDLGPYLRGEVTPIEPTQGVLRSDDLRMLYPGREHAVLGETESGKTWFALACVAIELQLQHTVIYIHFEESDPASTIERLQLFGVPPELIASRLLFVAPDRGIDPDSRAALLTTGPALVIADGVNEGMAMHGAATKDVEGWSEFRRRVITPFIKMGATVLHCDHMPMGADGSRRDAYGTVHKGAAVDGARFILENKEPFGRDMRGRSLVFVTKDRPGHLRKHGKPSKTPGRTWMGTFVVDATDDGFSVGFYAPKADEAIPATAREDVLGEQIYEAIAGLPGGVATSKAEAYAAFKAADGKARKQDVLDAIEVLAIQGRLEKVLGERKGSCGFKAVEIGSQTGN